MKSLRVRCPKCDIEFEAIESQMKIIELEVQKRIEIAQNEIEKKLASLHKKELQLKSLETSFDQKLEDALQQKIIEANKKARNQAAKDFETKLKDLESQLEEKNIAIQKSTIEQLKLTKSMRELRERELKVDLEVEQKVIEQVEVIQNESMKEAEERYKLKLAEKEKKIKDIETQLEAAKRTASQGSQQTQGEVFELELENKFSEKFPIDKFKAIPKGVSGADLIQIIFSKSGRKCGEILWEFKNTKTFSLGWIPKLKKDLLANNSQAGILVTKTLPKDSDEIEIIDGIFIVSQNLAFALARIVRKSIEDHSYAEIVSQGKDEKMQLIYNYLTGPTFNQKMKHIVNSFKCLKSDLEYEKRAIKKIWARREKQLDQVIDSAASMHGDLEGIAGSEIPQIEELSLTNLSLPEFSINH